MLETRRRLFDTLLISYFSDPIENVAKMWKCEPKLALITSGGTHYYEIKAD